MSPQSGQVLLEQIAPRLKAAVPYIKPVGCEDKEELFQDGLCMAAHLLESNELQGKKVPASSVAYYTILHLKSGRRSHSAARTDVMGSGTQLDGKTAVLSIETEVGFDPETMEPIRLGEFLSCSQDDPATKACRNIDWDRFIQSHDYRYGVLLKDLAEGKDVLARSKEWGKRYSQVRTLKAKWNRSCGSIWGRQRLMIPCEGRSGLGICTLKGNIQLAVIRKESSSSSSGTLFFSCEVIGKQASQELGQDNHRCLGRYGKMHGSPFTTFPLWMTTIVMTIFTRCLVAASPPALPANPQAQGYISSLRLEPLAGESGWFGGVNVSDLDVTSGGHTLKAHSSIYYLLTKETPINCLHQLDSDDVHVLLDGGPVDYFIFHPDGSVEQQTLGRNLKAGERLMISVPGGCWKALRMRLDAPYALMANVLSPQWSPDRVIIGAGTEFVSKYKTHAPWATESFLRELIGPNWK